MAALRQLRYSLTLGIFFFHCFAMAKVEVRENAIGAKHPDLAQIEKSLAKDALKTKSQTPQVQPSAWSIGSPEPQALKPKRKTLRKASLKKVPAPLAKTPPFLNDAVKPAPLPDDVFGIRLVRVSPKIERPEDLQSKKVAPKNFKILLVKVSPDGNRRKIPRIARRAASR